MRLPSAFWFVKVPFQVRYVTWNAVTMQKLTDVKFDAPVTDADFAKPAAPPRQ